MADLPAPPTPRDADLKVYKDMPLEVARFAKSGLIAKEDPEAIVAAILLWGSAWHELPAGSLPDDDKELANLAGYGRGVAAFLAIKSGALRGWYLCSDGRLYHDIVAEKVSEAWQSRLKHLYGNYCSAIRMYNARNKQDERQPLKYDQWMKAGKPKGVDSESTNSQADLPLGNDKCSPEHDADVRRTDGDSSPKSSPCSRQKGTEGNGTEGNGLNIAVAARETGAESHDWKLEDLSDHLCRVAGIRNVDPARIAENMSLVRTWIAAAADPPMLEQLMKDGRDRALKPIKTLLYFDDKVREAIARKEFPNENVRRSVAKRNGNSLDAAFRKAHDRVSGHPDPDNGGGGGRTPLLGHGTT